MSATEMDEFYIEFDTESNPGKLEAIKVAIGAETIAGDDLKRSLNIRLPAHPLYRSLWEFCKMNPPQ